MLLKIRNIHYRFTTNLSKIILFTIHINMKYSALFVLLTVMVCLGSSQILADSSFQLRIQGHYGKCCHYQYAFSVDISGSMSWYWSSATSFVNSWISSLVTQRAYSTDIWLSIHKFNDNNYPLITHKTPIHYNPLLLGGPSGGTNWNHAIIFLTQRLALRDHLIYIMITDTDIIYISYSVWLDFIKAYRLHLSYGCKTDLWFINIRRLYIGKLISAVEPATATFNLKSEAVVNFGEELKKAGVQASFKQPQSESEAQKYINDDANLF